MKPLFTLLLCIICHIAFSQATYEMSDPVEVSAESGWNKVLMMHNGNTLLFHLEPNKAITVKVFDKLHKEIASQRHICSVLDINALRNAILRGIYEINGEAVLFLEQPINNRNSLVRVRISAEDGHMVNESIVMRSPNFGNKYSFNVLKCNVSGGYKIFYSCDIHMYASDTMMLVSFSKDDEPKDTVLVDVDRAAYRYIQLYNIALDNLDNVNFTFLLANVDVSSARVATVYDPVPEKLDYRVLTGYVPVNSRRVFASMAQLGSQYAPRYIESSYNIFANNINLLFADGSVNWQRYGLGNVGTLQNKPTFVTVSTNDLSVSSKKLENNILRDTYKTIDSTARFSGIPLKMFTNENGLTTVVYEEYNMSVKRENGHNYPYTICGNIGLMQYNDQGDEIAGIVLPKGGQNLYNYCYAEQLAKEDDRRLFDIASNEYYKRQFFSTGSYATKRNVFIVYNDLPDNFADTAINGCVDVGDCGKAQAMYYKIGRRDSVYKQYLLGEPVAGESRSAVIDGADFDSASNTYATLVQCIKGDERTLRMAWCHLN